MVDAHASLSPENHQHQRHHHGADFARLLDLDARVHADLLTRALSAAVERSAGPVHRILDVGTGTGTGAIALARRFPEAEVVAVDRDPQLLDLVSRRAAAAGLGDRVHPCEADIGTAALGERSYDLAWSSSALHEVSDPAAALGAILTALRPGGLLVVMEMDATPLLLPPKLAGFEQRLRESIARPSPAEHNDWTAQLRAGGFQIVEVRRLADDQHVPATGDAGDYAVLELQRIARAHRPALDEQDGATLEQLLGDGPGSVHRLGKLWIRGSRTLWAARRP